MKIVIQQGHVINREDIELFLDKAPKAWSKPINSFTIYTSVQEPFRISYHPKDKVMGIHISEKFKGTSSEAIEEIAIASQAIEEFGHLPEKLSKARKTHFRQQWAKLGV